MKLAIDPSINTVGWATLEDNEWNWGYIKVPPKFQEINGRCHYITTQLPPPSEIAELIIEYPMFMMMTRGQIAAQKGYTIDLGYVAGYLSKHYIHSALFMPTPVQWKGQLPKHAVEARFLHCFGEEHKGTSDHAFEACMLLKWHQTGNLV